MPVLTTVILSTKGDVNKINIQLTSDGSITMDMIQKSLKKKDIPEYICYEYQKKYVFLFGYKKGKKGSENKHELQEPYSDTEFFGDILVLFSQDDWNNPLPYTIDQWNMFSHDIIEEEEEEEEVKDDFELSDNEKDDYKEEEEVEEVEIEEPVIVKRNRTPIYSKLDISVIKDDIDRNSEPETNIVRTNTLLHFSFLEKVFPVEDIRLLEKNIYETVYDYAQINYIARNWKIPVFCELYKQKVRSILSNLHPKSPVGNQRLFMRVIEGEFPLYNIPFMTSYEMYPEQWFTLKDKLLQREQKILEGNKSRATDQFKCRRCLKRECTYYELQTRSADEPMTIFITCLNCGKEWRQGG